MATSKFTPPPVPDQVSLQIRQYLDDTLNQVAQLLNPAADYIDDDTIAHTDDAETISAAWTFDDAVTFNSTVTGLDSDDLADVASIAMLDENETVSGAWNFTSGSVQFSSVKFTGTPTVSNTEPNFFMEETDAALNEKRWRFVAAGGNFYLQGREDSGQTFANPTAFKITRTANSLDDMTFNGDIIFDYTAPQHIQIGVDSQGRFIQFSEANTGVAAAIGSARETDASGLSYRTFWGYECYWDDDADNWKPFRSSLGRKMMVQQGYHIGGVEFSYNDTTASSWAQSAWTVGMFVDHVNARIEGRNGYGFLAYDNTDNDFTRLWHDGTHGQIRQSGGDGLRLLGLDSVTSRSGIYLAQTSAGDDSTTSITLPHGGGMWFIIGSTTSSAAVNDVFQGVWVSTTVNEAIYNRTATLSLGTGSNPDVDGDTNVWFTNGGATMNIKNRRGSFRYYSIIIFGGDI